MVREFEEYVSYFNLKEPAIIRKFYHSKRVAIISAKIAGGLNWNYHDVWLAKQTGLLHDIGRFKEWKKYKVYSGGNFDHAGFGVSVLKKDNFLSKLNVHPENRKLIYEAIYYHNKYEIPIKKKNKHIKLIRDADKIDILYLHTVYNNLHNHIKNNKFEVSPKINSQFKKERQLVTKNIFTYGDNVLYILAMVFDINYEYSLRYIKENKYIEKIYENTKNKEYYKDYFDIVFKFIEKRINKC